MTDLASRIEAAKNELDKLKSDIENVQQSKQDQTLAAVARSKGSLSQIRPPPMTKLRRTLKGHFGRVTALHWSGDARSLVSASQDGNLLVWNAVSANKLQSISLRSSYVMSVGFEQTKGQMVACGGLDNLCTVYKLSNPEVPMEMASHDGFVSCCRFLSDAHILSSSGDSTCLRWDLDRGEVLNTFAEHKQDVMFLSTSPSDVNVFCSCSVDRTVKVWDVRTKDSVQTFFGHEADINGVEYMPSDDKAFATCADDNTVRVFDVRASNQVCQWHVTPVVNNNTDNSAEEPDGPTTGFTSVTFSRSGRLLFTGHSDSNLRAFDVLSDKTTPTFVLNQAHERHISSVGVSPSGDALCSGSWDSFLKIWA